MNLHSRWKYFLCYGKPNSGKGTQAGFLHKFLTGSEKIGSGDLARERCLADTTFKAINEPKMARGEMLPDDVIIPLMDKKLEDVPSDRPLILDGIPRNVEQYRIVHEHLRRRGEIEKAVVLWIAQLSDVEVQERGRQRGRLDDVDASQVRRLRDFNSHHAGLLAEFRRSGIEIMAFDGRLPKDQLHHTIKLRLELIDPPAMSVTGSRQLVAAEQPDKDCGC